MKERLLSVNNYKKPKVLDTPKGNYYNILRLLLMEPGTNPLFPLMGIGIKSKSQFITEDKIQDLQVEINNQIEKYLSNLMATSVELVLDENKSLRISISTEAERYDFSSEDFDLSMDALVERYSEN